MKLNLGARDHRPAGFLSVDLGGADVTCDLSEMPWPWPSASACDILASHILEHFDRRTGLAFLSECWRVLEPGGVLRLAVPDMDKFADCRLSGDWTPVSGYPLRDFNHFLGGDDNHEADPHQRHRYMYTFENLAYKLRAIGFLLVTRRGPCELDNPAYHAISLYVDALK